MTEKIKKIVSFEEAKDKKVGAELGTNALVEKLLKGQEPHHTTKWPDEIKKKEDENGKTENKFEKN